MKKIFWIVGDVSADLHSAKILEKLKPHDLYHYGVGGYRMQEQGFVSLFDFEKLFVMGFWDVIRKIGFFLRMENLIKEKIKTDNPDLVVLVDYPGLNMRVAEFVKKLGIPVIYYIAPQFWAWKYRRVYKLKKFTDLVASILPFENEILQKEGVNSLYVGNPITEEINFEMTKDEFAEKFKLNPQKKWVSFFPGSRKSEIKRILPIFKETIEILKQDNDFEFIISQAKNLDKSDFVGIEAKVIKGYNYDLMKYSSALAITSGTATLEAAYISANFVIVYKTNPLNYLIGKKLIKTNLIGLPNILLKSEIYKELIQENANAKNLAKYLLELLKSDKSKTNLIRDILGEKSASETMSKLILEYAKR